MLRIPISSVGTYRATLQVGPSNRKWYPVYVRATSAEAAVRRLAESLFVRREALATWGVSAVPPPAPGNTDVVVRVVAGSLVYSARVR